MSKDLDKLFMHTKVAEPRSDLYDKIISRIQKERKLIVSRRRFFVFSITFLGSLIAFFPAVRMLQLEFVQSGFFQFLSLLFSDSEMVMTYWQNFVLTLLETLPVVSMVIFFGLLFIFLESLRFLFKDGKFIFSPNN